jgi:hypothetical protein
MVLQQASYIACMRNWAFAAHFPLTLWPTLCHSKPFASMEASHLQKMFLDTKKLICWNTGNFLPNISLHFCCECGLFKNTYSFSMLINKLQGFILSEPGNKCSWERGCILHIWSSSLNEPLFFTPAINLKILSGWWKLLCCLLSFEQACWNINMQSTWKLKYLLSWAVSLP